jgi:hypothetical protein
MRRGTRADANQPEIVAALRAAGCPVHVLSDVGGGLPDLLVGNHGVLYLLEVKDGDKPPSKRKLTEAEQKFFDDWHGYPVVKIENIYQALKAVGIELYGNRDNET